MFAAEKLAFAKVWEVTTDRHETVQEYVRARLRAEVSERGVAAKISKATGISPAHISNMTSARPTRGVGFEVINKLAAYWGTTYAALEAEALGMPGSSPTRDTIVVRDHRYAAMPAVLGMARAERLDEGFIAEFCDEENRGPQLQAQEQLGADELWSIMKDRYRSWKRERRGHVPLGEREGERGDF